jgi:adenine-specific DNA methylase
MEVEGAREDEDVDDGVAADDTAELAPANDVPLNTATNKQSKYNSNITSQENISL